MPNNWPKQPPSFRMKCITFEFPALFSPIPWSIWPVPDMNVSEHEHDPDHHQKFCRHRPRHLGLILPVTDRLWMERQMERLRRSRSPILSSPPPWRFLLLRQNPDVAETLSLHKWPFSLPSPRTKGSPKNRSYHTNTSKEVGQIFLLLWFRYWFHFRRFLPNYWRSFTLWHGRASWGTLQVSILSVQSFLTYAQYPRFPDVWTIWCLRRPGWLPGCDGCCLLWTVALRHSSGRQWQCNRIWPLWSQLSVWQMNSIL